MKITTISLLLAGLLMLVGCSQPTEMPAMPAMDNSSGDMAMTPSHNMPMPDDLDFSTTRPGEGGLIVATVTSDGDSIPINQMHQWTLHLETPDGQPIDNATVSVDGGMPQHGHGLPTEPQVTDNLGNGDYRVEGIKFQMPGWWEVKFAVEFDGQTDVITFNLMLN